MMTFEDEFTHLVVCVWGVAFNIIAWSVYLTTVLVWIPVGACEKVSSDLGIPSHRQLPKLGLGSSFSLGAFSFLHSSKVTIIKIQNSIQYVYSWWKENYKETQREASLVLLINTPAKGDLDEGYHCSPEPLEDPFQLKYLPNQTIEGFCHRVLALAILSAFIVQKHKLVFAVGLMLPPGGETGNQTLKEWI